MSGRGTNSVVLETRALSMHFGGVIALDHVDFLLWDRELRCLIGPNGAGKSTFFKCLTGQLQPTAGQILLNDADLTGAPTHLIARQGVGIKTQVPSLFEGLTVIENIALAARRAYQGRALDEQIDHVLERLSLTAIAERRAAELAHGQRQWVELAVVLAADPWLILLDEPAAGLSGDEIIRTAQIITELKQSATVIVIDHDMPFIRMIAETVSVFHQGTMLVEAPVAEVMRDPTVRDIYLGRHHEGRG